MEILEDEDMRRMGDLSGDDAEAIFADLQVDAKRYPKLQTTFDPALSLGAWRSEDSAFWKT